MRRVLLALLAVVAVAGALAGCTHEISADEGNWPDSAEFSELMTGQTRFSMHDTNLDGWRVLVDHETGVQYVVGNTAHTVCPLLDVDGSPLRVLEASNDGE